MDADSNLLGLVRTCFALGILSEILVIYLFEESGVSSLSVDSHFAARRIQKVFRLAEVPLL